MIFKDYIELNNKLYYILCFILATILSSCTTTQQEQEQDSREMYISNPKWGADLEIVKVRNCEYVLWYNGYGSDMEHYEGCNNTEHCE